MAANISHQDPARVGVGATAHIVAYYRQLETEKGDKALVVDPYAQFLALDIGIEALKSISWRLPDSSETLSEEDLQSLQINGMAVRTRKIDDEIFSALSNSNIKQVVVLGAGLDSRPWRLNMQSYCNNDMKKHLSEVHWYEVDFPEIFNFKLDTLAQHDAKTCCIYHNVIADLSLTGWVDILKQSGYDSLQPSFWLLEGFINYLKEDEAATLLESLYSDNTVKSGSKILMTSVSTSRTSGINLHHFRPTDPLEFVSKFGFSGKQDDFTDISQQYGIDMQGIWKGYYLVNVSK